ncbi:hypothetical protein J6590_055988 [Homalodisca vitripennis]|nr:hypothetical protein J6590_055988 [Homalodisca vitripennis]
MPECHAAGRIKDRLDWWPADTIHKVMPDLVAGRSRSGFPSPRTDDERKWSDEVERSHFTKVTTVNYLTGPLPRPLQNLSTREERPEIILTLWDVYMKVKILTQQDKPYQRGKPHEGGRRDVTTARVMVRNARVGVTSHLKDTGSCFC